MQKSNVEEIVKDVLTQWPSLFIIEVQVMPGNKIKITLDGDHSVTLKDCMAVSREIEGHFDREEEDFSLEVTSSGVTTPLVIPRQYQKNIGRKLNVKTADTRYKAALTKADKDGIALRWKQREPKPIGKGKHTVEKQVDLTYEQIEEAKVMITF